MGRVLLFDANTRLMCPNCLLVSSNHKTSNYISYVVSGVEYFVVNHTCKRCLHTDVNGGDNFIDFANYKDGRVEHLAEYKYKLDKLEKQAQMLRNEIHEIEYDYERIWQVNDDIEL